MIDWRNVPVILGEPDWWHVVAWGLVTVVTLVAVIVQVMGQ